MDQKCWQYYIEKAFIIVLKVQRGTSSSALCHSGAAEGREEPGVLILIPLRPYEWLLGRLLGQHSCFSAIDRLSSSMLWTRPADAEDLTATRPQFNLIVQRDFSDTCILFGKGPFINRAVEQQRL